MRTEIDVLLSRVEHEALRAELRHQIARLQSKRTFGLVFESRLPERVRLREHPLRPGMVAALKGDLDSPGYEVLGIEGDTAVVRKVQAPDGSPLSDEQQSKAAEERLPANTLVVLAGFGEPIYAGFRSLGSIGQGGDKPSHIVVKGENYHVLEAMQFTHPGRIDCIYIDPPYNSGARDWKYDNHYVDENDAYRHSKWLAFMERRLLLAKRLLKPEEAVLIVTIDEKEYLRLGLLLEQTFPSATIQMVTSVISAKGTSRTRELSRVHEHIFFVLIGDAGIARWTTNMLEGGGNEKPGEPVKWLQLRRREPSSTRASRPHQFYPIRINVADGSLHSIGESLEPMARRESVSTPEGTFTFWPLASDGREMVWGCLPEELRRRCEGGYFRVRNWNPKKQTASLQYLQSGTIEGIESGRIEVKGHGPDGAVIAAYADDTRGAIPKTVWNMTSHNAETYGTRILSALIPGRRFDYPKSLYAVEDTIRFFIRDKPAAVVLDFFGGSSTTTHAVARLNRQDGGRRQTILVTNNEVSAGEADLLRRQGLQPGDSKWEELGIFEHITRPRFEAAITGHTADGKPVHGDYRFADEFPMSKGFNENVDFLELTYLNADDVELDKALNGIAPLLWLRAGGRGPVITECLDAAGRRRPYAWTEHYGVLFNPDRWRRFVEELPLTATTVFIVTDSQTTFQGIAAEFSDSLDVVRLYENYMTTFAINQGLS